MKKPRLMGLFYLVFSLIRTEKQNTRIGAGASLKKGAVLWKFSAKSTIIRLSAYSKDNFPEREQQTS
jgi:hypothetical protein